MVAARRTIYRIDIRDRVQIDGPKDANHIAVGKLLHGIGSNIKFKIGSTNCYSGHPRITMHGSSADQGQNRSFISVFIIAIAVIIHKQLRRDRDQSGIIGRSHELSHANIFHQIIEGRPQVLLHLNHFVLSIGLSLRA